MKNLHKILQNSVQLSLGLTLLILSGCGNLTAETQNRLKYDAETDTFSYLAVFENIRAYISEDTSESEREKNIVAAHDYLAAIWGAREDIIFIPNPTGVSPEQVLYVGPHKYRMFNLSVKEDEPPELQYTDLQLDEIIVSPGDFFSSEAGTLCYYHITSYPGNVVDDLVRLRQKEISEGYLASAMKERVRRKTDSETVNWTSIQKYLAELREYSLSNQQELPEFPTVEEGDWTSILDDESIRLLITDAVSRQIKLIRKADVVTLSFRISAADAKSCKQTIDQLRDWITPRNYETIIAAINRSTDNSFPWNETESIRDALSIVRYILHSESIFSVSNDGKVSISIGVSDLSALLPELGSLANGGDIFGTQRYLADKLNRDAVQRRSELSRLAREAMTKKGFAVRNNITVEKVIQNFYSENNN